LPQPKQKAAWGGLLVRQEGQIRAELAMHLLSRKIDVIIVASTRKNVKPKAKSNTPSREHAIIQVCN
jgi:hypothetical protein